MSSFRDVRQLKSEGISCDFSQAKMSNNRGNINIKCCFFKPKKGYFKKECQEVLINVAAPRYGS